MAHFAKQAVAIYEVLEANTMSHGTSETVLQDPASDQSRSDLGDVDESFVLKHFGLYFYCTITGLDRVCWTPPNPK